MVDSTTPYAAGNQLSNRAARPRSRPRAGRSRRAAGCVRRRGVARPRRRTAGRPAVAVAHPRRARARARAGGRGRGSNARHHRLGPVDDRGGLDDVPRHAELLWVEPEGEADELGQVEHGEAELAPDHALGQRLLKVEVQVAERARRHQAVGVGVDGVAQMRAGLLERGVLVHRDDRDAAALVRARVVDDGPAERLDQAVQVLVTRRIGPEAEPVARPYYVAAVERPDLEVLQRPLDPQAQLVQPDVLDQHPEEVLVDDALLIAQAVGAQGVVDQAAVLGVRVQALLALALRSLARRADVHHQHAVGLLRERERARVERVGELLVVLGDDAGAAAARAVELDQLDIEQRGHLGHGAVELGREAARHATGPVRDLHALDPSVSTGMSLSPSSSSPAMYRLSSNRSSRPSILSKICLIWARSSLGILSGRSAPIGVTLRRTSARVIDGSESASSSPAAGANLPKNESPP